MKKTKGINLSATILSEEDKKKAEESAKPRVELTLEQKQERKKEKKELKEQKEENKKEPHIITLFKMKNKVNWRMLVGTLEGNFVKPENIPENITEIKIIKIDRITGELK